MQSRIDRMEDDLWLLTLDRAALSLDVCRLQAAHAQLRAANRRMAVALAAAPAATAPAAVRDEWLPAAAAILAHGDIGELVLRAGEHAHRLHRLGRRRRHR
ncbi:hypothetical protein H4R21_002897 [Coemansia helicoidea]|uniref:Uncharacterized protein n=1 Tax=Coemansia helicoidea TaxID=1286919 RepID=A0ACC1L608_9FUNG|nr:hypothetical protein H4R21_002897 [Coemansia helicoidea]